MTKKEVQALNLSLSDDGFALCKESKAGKMIPVRKITDEEIVSMLSAMYARHIIGNPENPVMMIPIDANGNALAVTFAQPNKEVEKVS